MWQSWEGEDSNVPRMTSGPEVRRKERKMQDEGPGNCEDSVTPRSPWPYLPEQWRAGEDVQGGCRLSSGF